MVRDGSDCGVLEWGCFWDGPGFSGDMSLVTTALLVRSNVEVGVRGGLHALCLGDCAGGIVVLAISSPVVAS